MTSYEKRFPCDPVSVQTRTSNASARRRFANVASIKTRPIVSLTTDSRKSGRGLPVGCPRCCPLGCPAAPDYTQLLGRTCLLLTATRNPDRALMVRAFHRLWHCATVPLQLPPSIDLIDQPAEQQLSNKQCAQSADTNSAAEQTDGTGTVVERLSDLCMNVSGGAVRCCVWLVLWTAWRLCHVVRVDRRQLSGVAHALAASPGTPLLVVAPPDAGVQQLLLLSVALLHTGVARWPLMLAFTDSQSPPSHRNHAESIVAHWRRRLCHWFLARVGVYFVSDRCDSEQKSTTVATTLASRALRRGGYIMLPCRPSLLSTLVEALGSDSGCSTDAFIVAASVAYENVHLVSSCPSLAFAGKLRRSSVAVDFSAPMRLSEMLAAVHGPAALTCHVRHVVDTCAAVMSPHVVAATVLYGQSRHAYWTLNQLTSAVQILFGEIKARGADNLALCDGDISAVVQYCLPLLGPAIVVSASSQSAASESDESSHSQTQIVGVVQSRTDSVADLLLTRRLCRPLLHRIMADSVVATALLALVPTDCLTTPFGRVSAEAALSVGKALPQVARARLLNVALHLSDMLCAASDSDTVECVLAPPCLSLLDVLSACVERLVEAEVLRDSAAATCLPDVDESQAWAGRAYRRLQHCTIDALQLGDSDSDCDENGARCDQVAPAHDVHYWMSLTSDTRERLLFLARVMAPRVDTFYSAVVGLRQLIDSELEREVFVESVLAEMMGNVTAGVQPFAESACVDWIQSCVETLLRWNVISQYKCENVSVIYLGQHFNTMHQLNELISHVHAFKL